jgi:uncharacterized coiled-coil protein SlyX
MEINQILIQKGNDNYETRIIIQEGPISSISRNIVETQDLTDEQLKILGDFIKMIENYSIEDDFDAEERPER